MTTLILVLLVFWFCWSWLKGYLPIQSMFSMCGCRDYMFQGMPVQTWIFDRHLMYCVCQEWGSCSSWQLQHRGDKGCHSVSSARCMAQRWSKSQTIDVWISWTSHIRFTLESSSCPIFVLDPGSWDCGSCEKLVSRSSYRQWSKGSKQDCGPKSIFVDLVFRRAKLETAIAKCGHVLPALQEVFALLHFHITDRFSGFHHPILCPHVWRDSKLSVFVCRSSTYTWNYWKKGRIGNQRNFWSATFSILSFTTRFCHNHRVNGLVCGTSNCFSTVLCSNQVLVLVLTTVETCFIEQLYKDKRSYDYKSVRRWTTQKKIGYSLVKCDKVTLIPVHRHNGLGSFFPSASKNCMCFCPSSQEFWFCIPTDPGPNPPRCPLVLGSHKYPWQKDWVPWFSERCRWHCSSSPCKLTSCHYNCDFPLFIAQVPKLCVDTSLL